MPRKCIGGHRHRATQTRKIRSAKTHATMPYSWSRCLTIDSMSSALPLLTHATTGAPEREGNLVGEGEGGVSRKGKVEGKVRQAPQIRVASKGRLPDMLMHRTQRKTTWAVSHHHQPSACSLSRSTRRTTFCCRGTGSSRVCFQNS